MTPNPYQPPGLYGGSPPGPAPGAGVPIANRTPFVLAAVGSGLASAYWAAITLLLGLSAATGGASGVSVIMPTVLIVLYATRAFQVYKGDPAAARRLVWLHAVGAVFALLQALQAGGFVAALQGVKVVINVFGCVTAYLAQRAFTKSLGVVAPGS